MTNPSEQQFGSTVEAAAAWQLFLDEQFSRGATFTPVLPDGMLSTAGRYNFPVVAVASMYGSWPVLTSFDGDRDVVVIPQSWEDLDRDGHYAARIDIDPVCGRSGKWEYNSWFSDSLAEKMAPWREKLRAVLRDHAQFVGPFGELDIEAEPSES